MTRREPSEHEFEPDDDEIDADAANRALDELGKENGIPPPVISFDTEAKRLAAWEKLKKGGWKGASTYWILLLRKKLPQDHRFDHELSAILALKA